MSNSEETRPLRGSEIVKILNSIIYGFCDWCELEEILRAVEYYAKYNIELKGHFTGYFSAKKMMEQNKK